MDTLNTVTGLPFLTDDSDMMGGCLAAYPLRGERIVLRPLQADVLMAMVALANDREVAALTGQIPHPYTQEDGLAFLAGTREAHQRGESLRLAIERRTDGQFLGIISLEAVDGHPASLEIGYWLGREHWGQRYAAEAMRLLLTHAFDDLGAARLLAHVLPANGRSQALLQRSGFSQHASPVQAPFPRLSPQPTLCQRWSLERSAFAEWRKSRLVLVTAVALIDQDNRVLLQQRPEGKQLAGLWEFPGGKVEAGETPEQALVRELQEELGIDIRQSCLAPLTFASHAYGDFHLLMPLYLCRQWRGTPRGREGQALVWVKSERLSDYPMPPADIPLIPILRDWL